MPVGIRRLVAPPNETRVDLVSRLDFNFGAFRVNRPGARSRAGSAACLHVKERESLQSSLVQFVLLSERRGEGFGEG